MRFGRQFRYGWARRLERRLAGLWWGGVRLAVVSLVVCLVFFWLAGVPRVLLRKVLAMASAGEFVVEADSARLSPLRGIVLRDFGLFRKGLAGPGCVEAEEALLGIAPVSLMPGERLRLNVRLSGGAIRPLLVAGKGALRGGVDDGLGVSALRVDVAVADLMIEGVRIQRGHCVVQTDPYSVDVSDITLQVERAGMLGQGRGRVRYMDRDSSLHVEMSAQMDPNLIKPALEVWGMPITAGFFTRFAFTNEAPRFDLDFTCKVGQPVDLVLNGRVFLEDCVYNSVPALRADGRLEVRLGKGVDTVRIDPLLVVRDEGLLRGRLGVDFLKEQFAFDFVSAIEPRALAGLVGGFSDDFLGLFRVGGPVRIEGHGVADLAGAGRNEFALDVDAKNLGVKRFAFDDAMFRVVVSGRTNRIEGARGHILDGTAAGSGVLVALPPEEGGLQYDMELSAWNVDLEDLLRSLAPDTDPKTSGRLKADLKLSGSVDDPATAVGCGSIDIGRGRIFSLPLFGGFSNLMTEHVPGLDFVLRQTDVSADFNVANGSVVSENVKIDGALLSLAAKGKCDFSKELDFEVQVHFLQDQTLVDKVVRIVTYPISKLFEFRLCGTVDKPRWRAMNFSKEMLETLTGNGRKTE